MDGCFCHTHVLLVLSAVSQEIEYHNSAQEREYKNIAEEARDKQYLLLKPHTLSDFLSTERNHVCPPDLEEIDPHSSENTVLIPKLHQTFAQCLHASVSTLDGGPSFEVDFRKVLDSRGIETMGHLKPDIVVMDTRYKHIKFYEASLMLVLSCKLTCIHCMMITLSGCASRHMFVVLPLDTVGTQ